MKTAHYNPSKLEIEFAKAIVALKPELEKHLNGVQVIDVQPDYTSDNPYVVIRTEDADGDHHELVMQVIQRPDGYVK